GRIDGFNAATWFPTWMEDFPRRRPARQRTGFNAATWFPTWMDGEHPRPLQEQRQLQRGHVVSHVDGTNDVAVVDAAAELQRGHVVSHVDGECGASGWTQSGPLQRGHVVSHVDGKN